jgi:hypothetical protein
MAKPAQNHPPVEPDVEALKAQLEAEQHARIEAENRASEAEAKVATIEDANDFSVRNSVVTEAVLVSQIGNKRQPQVSEMAFGIQRVDF